MPSESFENARQIIIRISIRTLHVNPTEFKNIFWAGPPIILSGLPIYDLGLACQQIVIRPLIRKLQT